MCADFKPLRHNILFPATAILDIGRAKKREGSLTIILLKLKLYRYSSRCSNCCLKRMSEDSFCSSVCCGTSTAKSRCWKCGRNSCKAQQVAKPLVVLWREKPRLNSGYDTLEKQAHCQKVKTEEEILPHSPTTVDGHQIWDQYERVSQHSGKELKVQDGKMYQCKQHPSFHVPPGGAPVNGRELLRTIAYFNSCPNLQGACAEHNFCSGVSSSRQKPALTVIMKNRDRTGSCSSQTIVA